MAVLIGFFYTVNLLLQINIHMNKDLQFCVFWCHSGRLKMFWSTFDFARTFIKKWGRLFHCNTGTIRKQKVPLPCYSIMPSDNYINIKACSQNGQSHSSVQWKNYCRSSQQLFLLMLTSLPWHRKVDKKLLPTYRKYLELGWVTNAIKFHNACDVKMLFEALIYFVNSFFEI